MGKRFIIAGGGTGGHIFPAIAIANALKQLDKNHSILFVGALGRMEMEKVPQAGFEIKGLDIAGFNRSSLIKNISLPWKLVKSFFQVRKIVGSFQPDAVIGVGGYSSFPVLRYAQVRRIPTFIHESNSFAGRSNILLGRKATKVFVATDGMDKFFPAEKLVITGNPIRPVITSVDRIRKEEALAHFNLKPGKTTILAVGGSLGARSINEAIDRQLEDLLKNDVQLIWQTGKPYAAKARERVAGKSGVWAGDFITAMELGYAAADIVISRAGAMAIAELSVVQKPVVFVPYPFAAEDHQTFNAKNLVAKDAAWMVKDSEAAQKLVPMILLLSDDMEKREQLKTNIGKHAVRNADDQIAYEIIKNI